MILNIWKPILAWVLVIVWMGVIFYFSSQNATESKETSVEITKKTLITVDKVVPIEKTNRTIDDMAVELNHKVRKFSHYFEYLVLGALLSIAFKLTFSFKLINYIYAFIVGVCYASLDEWHQGFVDGRGPMIKDVFIDSFGVITGVLISLLIFYNFNKKRHNIVILKEEEE